MSTFDVIVIGAGHAGVEAAYASARLGCHVGLCTLSRADALVKAAHADAAQAVLIAETFTRQARRRMSRNVRGLDHNDDKAIERLAGAVLERGSYPFDVI